MKELPALALGNVIPRKSAIELDARDWIQCSSINLCISLKINVPLSEEARRRGYFVKKAPPMTRE